MILLYQQWGLDVFDWFLSVIALQVSHPLYKILQLFSPFLMLVATDGLDFILFYIIDKIRWWS